MSVDSLSTDVDLAEIDVEQSAIDDIHAYTREIAHGDKVVVFDSRM